jgi:hypothetical protein
MVSDSDLRQALIGTWRLISLQETVDGAVVKPLGDNPQGYLVYTTDDHVFVQFATRFEVHWPGPEVLELPGSPVRNAIGWGGYCGTFEVRDSQLVHHMEFGFLQRQSGRIETRSAALEGDPVDPGNTCRRAVRVAAGPESGKRQHIRFRVTSGAARDLAARQFFSLMWTAGSSSRSETSLKVMRCTRPTGMC